MDLGAIMVKLTSSTVDLISNEEIPLNSSLIVSRQNHHTNESVYFGARVEKDNTIPHLNLSWQNLNVWHTKIIERRFWKGNLEENVQILHNVNGSIESGTLTAIIGPSGAGKTTLLAAISMRVQGNITGNMTLNGYPVTKKILNTMSGFVPQEDLMFNSLTVLEHMHFMAKMKMDRRTKDATRRSRVEELIKEMGLSKCSKTKLGKISSGEKKRLSLAVQLINDPPILLCDEPTTGLDSWAAATVVSKLRTLAESGRAILCVLHQPASDIFQLFHNVILVANGRVAYHGALNGASEFCKQQGYHCPIGYNEAEFLVNTISTEDGSRAICSAWQTTAELHCVTDGASTSSFEADMRFQQYSTIEKTSKISQFYYLLWRSMKEYNKEVFVIKFISLMFIALIISLPYQNIFSKMEQRSIQNIQGMIDMITINVIFASVYWVFDTFLAEVPIFLREIANDLYSLEPYYLSKAVIMIPKTTIEAFMYTCLIYLIIGHNDGFVGFLIFTSPMICAAFAANAYGAWLSTSFRSFEIVAIVSILLDFVSALFDGFALNLNSLSVYVGWMRYLSIFFYTAEAVSVIQWSQIDKINCDPRPELTCLNSGTEVLKYYGFGKDNLMIDLLGLLGIYLGFHILAFISLWRRSKSEPIY